MCFRVYLEVNVHKNPTCFSRWSVSSTDDAIHSDSNVTIDGESTDITISTGDDGIHANETLTIENGKILVEKKLLPESIKKNFTDSDKIVSFKVNTDDVIGIIENKYKTWMEKNN